MESLFIQLYPIVAFVTAAGYIPQLKIICFSKCDLRNISLNTWIIWATASSISMGYGLTSLHDFMFCLVSAIHLFAQLFAIVMILYKRVVFHPSRIPTYSEA